MADSQLRRTGSNPAARADSRTAGMTVDPGPYEAIVVKQVESDRSGRLVVYIPDWGGLQTDPKNQIVVSYASPFFGTTYGTDSQNLPNSSFTSGQSYGFWMVPPDVGNKVLVTFAAGDRNRGYWFACCYDSPSHHMVPGLARNIGGKSKVAVSDQIKSYVTSDAQPPVVEAATSLSEVYTNTGIDSTQRYAHDYQTMKLTAQGLINDPIRGAISSSSLRESPSNVYGISTPGRSMTKTPQLGGSNSVDAAQAVIARRGGHTFVMDDGDKDGNDQLIRLRTAGGHQILMNDTAEGKGVLYIASATGNQWLEFSSDGSINMFGIAGFNLRSQGPLNLHSDSQVNINSGGALNLNATSVKITALTSASMEGLVSASVITDGFLTLSAIGKASLGSGVSTTVSSVGATSIFGATVGLNNPSYVPVPVKPAVPNLGNSLPDVVYGGSTWQYAPGALKSVCTRLPAHEPWIDPGTGQRPKATSGGTGLAGAALSLGVSAASKLI